jgi:PIN domain nuclease of toxin-antitoxin system
MPSVVADTHAAVWYLSNDRRLSRAAGSAMDEANAGGDPILIPAISLVELTYLVEKGRVPALARQRLVEAMADPDGPYELVALDGVVADAVERIDRSAVPDLPDRVIAATALARGVPLISRDGKIRDSTIQTIW